MKTLLLFLLLSTPWGGMELLSWITENPQTFIVVGLVALLVINRVYRRSREY